MSDRITGPDNPSAIREAIDNHADILDQIEGDSANNGKWLRTSGGALVWEDVPEIAAGDGIDLTDLGSVTLVEVDSSVWRDTDFTEAAVRTKTVGQYYYSSYAPTTTAMTMTQSRLAMTPTVLASGVIDRMGVEVTASAAGAQARMGVFYASGDKPGNLIAECGPVSASGAIGWQVATINAPIPETGLYYVGAVVQGAVPTLRHAQGGHHPMPLGSAVPAVTTIAHNVRHQSGVTGALPTTPVVPENALDATNPRLLYRYGS